jgi:hypothetical protein
VRAEEEQYLWYQADQGGASVGRNSGPPPYVQQENLCPLGKAYVHLEKTYIHVKKPTLFFFTNI